MNKLITAIAATSMLLAGPALADRSGNSKSQATGSAFEKASSEHRREARSEHWRGDDKRKELKSSYRPARDDRGQSGDRGQADRGQHRGRDQGQTDRGQHRGRDQNQGDRGQHRGRDQGQTDRGQHRGHDQGRDNRAEHRGRDRHSDRPDYSSGYRDRGHSSHDRPRYSGHSNDYYGKRHKRYYRHYWRPSHYHYGYRWRHLPRNYVRITLGGLGLFYSDGIFYRPHDHGYVVARAPLGAIVHTLPGSAVSVVFGDSNYYVAYDTYYLWDAPSRGYRVVANPGFD